MLTVASVREVLRTAGVPRAAGTGRPRRGVVRGDVIAWPGRRLHDARERVAATFEPLRASDYWKVTPVGVHYRWRPWRTWVIITDPATECRTTDNTDYLGAHLAPVARPPTGPRPPLEPSGDYDQINGVAALARDPFVRFDEPDLMSCDWGLACWGDAFARVGQAGCSDAPSAKGQGGELHFDGRVVTIARKGFLARATVGKGEKRIPVQSIAAVQWKPAGALVNG